MTEPQPDIELTAADAASMLAAWRGRPVRCTRVERLAGGMVNSVFRLDLDEPPGHVVAKVHGAAGSTFGREATALRLLREQTDCPVPEVLHHEDGEELVGHAFLLLEHVAGVCADHVEFSPDERAALDRDLAALLADLHQHTGDHWGRIDHSEQASSWRELVTARLAAARSRPTVAARLDVGVLDRLDAAIAIAPTLLDDPGAPRLVHGDVWDGNLLVRREDGRWRIAGLLDPDLQFADVEAEIAYLEAFDNPRPALRAAYEARRPLRPGYEQRRLVHWLDTALVHVALFEHQVFRDFTERTVKRILAVA